MNINGPLEACTPDELKQISQLVCNETGHDFSCYKSKTISRRIHKRMSLLQLHEVSDYIYYIHQTQKEIRLLFNELLINVTSFFRDPEAWVLLKQELLERIGKHKGPCFRVWVPGCSTGEEAYSVAILLQECMSLLHVQFDVQIFATDLDETAIGTARLGVFPLSIEQDVSSERLAKFFIKQGDTYKIEMAVRKTIIFAVQNLIKDPPFTQLNLLSCRNLLIYLKSELQKKTLPLFYYSLNPDGLLFIGPSENMGDFLDCFHVISKRWNIYGQIAGVTRLKSTIGLFSIDRLPNTSGENLTEKMTDQVGRNLSYLVKKVLEKKYTPAFIILDEKGDIVYVYGRTSQFLELASGQVHFHFMDMVRSELKSHFDTAIAAASTQQKEIILNKLEFVDQGITKYLNVSIRPVIEKELSEHKLLLIMIEEFGPLQPDVIASGVFKKTKQRDNRVIQLEHELLIAKESLQTSIEELETSNEELKSSNEELQSTNEELRSLNEELTTVNAELESRIEQLSSANDDIKNLLDHTEIATIFLDKDLCIKRFTPKTMHLIHLIPADIGRPIAHIVSNLNYTSLIEDARQVLKTCEPSITEAVDKTGQWYEIKIIPYRTVTDLIDGVIITFLNVHAKKEAEQKLKTFESEMTMLERFKQTLHDITLIIEGNGTIMMVNPHFLTQFNIKSEAVLGASIYQLDLGWDNQHLKKLMDKLLEEKDRVLTTTLDVHAHQTVNMTAYKISASIIVLVLSPC